MKRSELKKIIKEVIDEPSKVNAYEYIISKLKTDHPGVDFNDPPFKEVLDEIKDLLKDYQITTRQGALLFSGKYQNSNFKSSVLGDVQDMLQDVFQQIN